MSSPISYGTDAKVRLRTLPRIPPLEIQLQSTDTFIQWRLGNAGTWQDLVALADLIGPPGNDGADGLMTSVVAGTGITVDSTDPANPIVTANVAQANVAGLTTADSPQFAGLNVGDDDDTTITRGAAGFLAVEGNRVPSPAAQASGDLLYRGAAEWERLPKGTALQALRMNAGATAPEWGAAGGGWTSITSQQLTTDGTSMTFTGLSGYRHIKIVYALQLQTAGAELNMRCRVSAGSFRDLGALTATGVSDDVLWGSVEISNFNSTVTFKVATAVWGSSSTDLDNTNNIENFNANSARTAYASYQEVWDEIELAASTGNILGTTAGTRGYVYIFGMA